MTGSLVLWEVRKSGGQGEQHWTRLGSYIVYVMVDSCMHTPITARTAAEPTQPGRIERSRGMMGRADRECGRDWLPCGRLVVPTGGGHDGDVSKRRKRPDVLLNRLASLPSSDATPLRSGSKWSTMGCCYITLCDLVLLRPVTWMYDRYQSLKGCRRMSTAATVSHNLPRYSDVSDNNSYNKCFQPIDNATCNARLSDDIVTSR